MYLEGVARDKAAARLEFDLSCVRARIFFFRFFELTFSACSTQALAGRVALQKPIHGWPYAPAAGASLESGHVAGGHLDSVPDAADTHHADHEDFFGGPLPHSPGEGFEDQPYGLNEGLASAARLDVHGA